jgi:hypothetical protein
MLVNLDEVIRGHRHFLARNERAIDQALTTAGRHGVDHVQKNPKFQRRTGKLQDKTTASRIIRTSGGKLIRLMNPLPYAAAIDTGSKAHNIKPRRRKFLRFTVRGKLVFARSVRHPGTKPYKFLWRATHSAHRVMGEDLRRQMTDIAKRF